jgi:hypothetical protein
MLAVIEVRRHSHQESGSYKGTPKCGTCGGPYTSNKFFLEAIMKGVKTPRLLIHKTSLNFSDLEKELEGRYFVG